MDRLSEDSKKKVAAGVALTGLAAMAYLLYKKINSCPDHKDYQIDEDLKEEVVEEHAVEEESKCCSGMGCKDMEPKKECGSYQELLEQEMAKFKKSLVNGTQVMDLDCLKQIMASSAKLSEEDFKVLTRENREVRRALKESDMGGYITKLNEYTEQTQNLMVKHQQTFTEALGIPERELEECMNYFMQQGFMQQIYMLGAQQSVLLKNCLQGNVTVTSALAIDIFQFQVDYIKKNPQIFETIAQTLMNAPMEAMDQEAQMEMMQRIPALLNLVISDEAQTEFGVEEEDLVTFLQNPANLQDRRLVEVMQQLQMLVQSMMGPMGGM